MAENLKAGRYAVERELGRGGMGRVLLAQDTKLPKKVALKMLPPEVAHDAELLRRLAQEAQAASTLNHPGIVTVHDYIEAAGESFIVYEYVEGVTLRQSLGQRQLSIEEVLELGAQFADALVHAHEHGVIHRDLKPGNIMIVPATSGIGRAKILDFGLAKIRPPLAAPGAHGLTSAETKSTGTAAGWNPGTFEYMAPEQHRGQPADTRSDIFAFGLVLYESAAGVNPFLGDTPQITAANIMNLDPPPLSARMPSVPAEFERILRKCLRKRPEERYQSARELLVDLNNFRRDSTPRPSQEAALPKLKEMERPLGIPRSLARGLVAAIQVGYLATYVTAFLKKQDVFDALDLMERSGLRGATGIGFSILLLVALSGTCVRLYLLSAVAMDYADLGRKYRRLFPAALSLDLAWSLVALLTYVKVEMLALLFFVGLAYLPFTQRPLLYSAYSPLGGRTSGLRAGGSA